MNRYDFKDLIDDLNFLLKMPRIKRSDVPKIKDELKTETFKNYLEVIWLSKPETAFESVFDVFLSVVGIKGNIPQASLSDGWVDYEVNMYGSNPVGIEVKPLFVKKTTQGIELQRLESILDAYSKEFEKRHSNQITKYLDKYDYVILTNGEHVYYFNREARFDFKPFNEEPFVQFIEELRAVRNPWELARRKEDEIPKTDLDERFFKDLSNWYSMLDNVKWEGKPQEIEEFKILLLNKFIFIQTLEDYSLVPFKILQDTYEDKKRRWVAKGNATVLKEFFNEINGWFYRYYDTEIFRRSIFEFLERSEDNYKKFMDTLEIILGFGRWERAHGMGLTFYNFRQIDEDIFGKSYEMFLAEKRKEGGIFYTPKEITNYMAKNLVREVFGEIKERLIDAINNKRDFQTAKSLAEQLTNIAVIDPACGSGSFLIKVLREIYEVYKEIDEKTAWAVSHNLSEVVDEPLNIRQQREQTSEIREMLGISEGGSRSKRRLIAQIMLRHIYGIDIDERAAEIAKVNLWKEAVKLNPGSFVYNELKEDDHILPDLEFNIVVGNSLYTLPEAEIFNAINENEELKEHVRTIMDVRKQYVISPYEPEILQKGMEARQRLREYFKGVLNERWELAPQLNKPVFYPLEFPHLYFNEDGTPKEDRGFDGVIGNPPWENIKPFKKEFAAHYPEIFGQVSKYSISGKEFEKQFKKILQDNPAVGELWEDYQQSIEQFGNYLKGMYNLHGKGDISYQKFFMELALRIFKKTIIILLPSNFHTDLGGKDLRSYVLDNHSLKELISFENRGKRWFKDVHPQFKFDIVYVKREHSDSPFHARFYVREWNEVEKKFEYPVEMITKISPRAKTITEFLDPVHIPLIRKIRDEHPLLYEWGVSLWSEFHMTNDKHLFQLRPTETTLPLYEGKMIHQYNSQYGSPQYFIEEQKARERLIGKKINGEIVSVIKNALDGMQDLSAKAKKELRTRLLKEAHEKFESREWLLDYEVPRFAYRAVASSTNERSLIGAILPPRVFAGNSLIMLKQFSYEFKNETNTIEQIPLDASFNLYLQILWNSFALDYYIRQRVSANINIFFAEELPIPKSSIYNHLVNFSKSLQRMTENNKPNLRKWRAKVECIIARDIFELDRSDMETILKTFTYGNIDEELKSMILEEFDK